MTNFNDLKLNDKILSTLEKKGYSNPTPIQEQAIPHLLQGSDVLGIAQTGTGKTAAFSLPILHLLSQNKIKPSSGRVRALVLTPTRELASQICDNIKIYSAGLQLKSTAIFGGLSINNQVREMRSGFDILIATPGRLLDLMNRKAVHLDQVEILVLDEADRMLDMGFLHDVKKVIACAPQNRQSLFFSATMAKEVANLANSMLKTPIKIEITPQSTTVEKIAQKINYVSRANKLHLLKSLLNEEGLTSTLVFSKTKHGANKIVSFLQDENIKTSAIHGNKTQAAREKALRDFRSNKVKVLVATDIAARGIDVTEISHVINFDIPHDPENYVHRIGRTARAGKSGIAISFCDASEKSLLKTIEKTINYQIPVDKNHEFHNESTLTTKKFTDKKSGPSLGRSGGKAAARSGEKRKYGFNVKTDEKSSRKSGKTSKVRTKNISASSSGEFSGSAKRNKLSRKNKKPYYEKDYNRNNDLESNQNSRFSGAKTSNFSNKQSRRSGQDDIVTSRSLGSSSWSPNKRTGEKSDEAKIFNKNPKKFDKNRSQKSSYSPKNQYKTLPENKRRSEMSTKTKDGNNENFTRKEGVNSVGKPAKLNKFKQTKKFGKKTEGRNAAKPFSKTTKPSRKKYSKS